MIWKSLLVPSFIRSGACGSKNAICCTFQQNVIKQLAQMSSSAQQKMDVNGQTINYLKMGKGFPLLCLPGALG